MRFIPSLVKPKTIKLVFVASPPSRQHYGVRAKTRWLRIQIMCPSCRDMSTHGLLFQSAITWYRWKIAHFVLNNNQSLTHYLRCFFSKLKLWFYYRNFNTWYFSFFITDFVIHDTFEVKFVFSTILVTHLITWNTLM